MSAEVCPCCEYRASRPPIFYDERLKAELGRTWMDEHHERRRREIYAQCISRRHEVEGAAGDA